VDKLTISLKCLGSRFEFDLDHRRLKLPECDPVDYYWMDDRQLRRGDCPNYRACRDLWWAAMESKDLTVHHGGQDRERELDVDGNQMTLVQAELWPHVCESKGQQTVFRDARLRYKRVRARRPDDVDEDADEEAGLSITLDDVEDHRLRAIAQRRDIREIREAIREVFAGGLPQGAEKDALNTEYNEFMDKCIAALESEGREGLRAHLRDEVVPHLQRWRRRGGRPQETRFLNLLVYNSKISFYTCFANAWVCLIPWLKEHENLDARSERLLRLWHFRQRRIDEKAPDVFWGQTLSLHPISGIIMKQPYHQLVLARYLDSDTDVHDAANSEYWDLVGAILVACHEYRALRDRQEIDRHERSLGEASGDAFPSE